MVPGISTYYKIAQKFGYFSFLHFVHIGNPFGNLVLSFPLTSTFVIEWQLTQDTPSSSPIGFVSLVSSRFLEPDKREIGSWQPPQYRVDAGPFSTAMAC